VGDGAAIYANRAPRAAGAGWADIIVAMTTTPPTTIVRFDIRSIPEKPAARFVRRRVKAVQLGGPAILA
jgi:hypothetical protein